MTEQMNKSDLIEFIKGIIVDEGESIKSRPPKQNNRCRDNYKMGFYDGRREAALEILGFLGVECRKDEGVIDEIPMAYKSIDSVMAAQKDLVKPVAILKQVLCIKG